MKTIFIKTKAVVALFLCLLTLAPAGVRPAHAGSWKITYDPVNGESREIRGTAAYYPNGADFNNPWVPRLRGAWAGDPGYTAFYGIREHVMYTDGFYAYHSPGGGAFTFGASSVNIRGTFNVIFTWTTDPSRDLILNPDPPPSLLFFRETSNVGFYGAALAPSWIENVVVDNGLGHTARSPDGAVEGTQSESRGSRCVLVKTGGKSRIKLSRTLRAGGAYKQHTTDIGGYMDSDVYYKAELGDFALYASVNPFNILKNLPNNREYDAYVKPGMRPEFVDDLESKFEDFDFWQGPGSYSIRADVNGQTAFNPQKYEWQVDGADLTPLPKDADVAVIDNQRPEGSTPYKTFNFDFGDIDEASLDKFSKPITTTVNVTVSGPGEDANSTSEILTAKAKVNWHLTAGDVYELKATIVALAPPDEQDNPGDSDWAAAEGVDAAKKQAQRTLGVSLQGTLQTGVFIASFWVPTDITDVALGLPGKSAKVFIKAKEALGPMVTKFLNFHNAKRVAAGKRPNFAANLFLELKNKGSKGTRRPNLDYGPDEAGTTIKKAARVGYCFVAGTLVVMADGSTKAIEDVKRGDEVMSRDENNSSGEVKAKKVVQLFKRLAKQTVTLQFAGGERIECTPEHPFYVEGRGFVKAGELGVGNSIVTRAGPSVAVENIERKDESATVYNFEVEDFHTYFVGNTSNGLWVHNSCESDAIAKYAWSDHCGEQGGEFINHARFGSVGYFRDIQVNGRGFIKEQDFSDFIDSVMLRPSRNAPLANGGRAYFDRGNNVIVVHRHDDDFNTLAKPGTCYRGDEDEFERVVAQG